MLPCPSPSPQSHSFRSDSCRSRDAYINSTILTIIFFVCAVYEVSCDKNPGKTPKRLRVASRISVRLFRSGDRRSREVQRFLPLVGTLFLFIVLSNWMGLLPWDGNHRNLAADSRRNGTDSDSATAASDMNLTLAMAILSVAASHVFGMFTRIFHALEQIHPTRHALERSPLIQARRDSDSRD